MAEPDDWIKSRAYELWEQEGRPHGKHDEHWEQARQEYAASHNTGKKSSGSKTAIAAEPVANDPVIETASTKPVKKDVAKPAPKTAQKAAAIPKPAAGASRKKPSRKASTT